MAHTQWQGLASALICALDGEEVQIFGVGVLFNTEHCRRSLSRVGAVCLLSVAHQGPGPGKHSAQVCRADVRLGCILALEFCLSVCLPHPAPSPSSSLTVGFLPGRVFPHSDPRNSDVTLGKERIGKKLEKKLCSGVPYKS